MCHTCVTWFRSLVVERSMCHVHVTLIANVLIENNYLDAAHKARVT